MRSATQWFAGGPGAQHGLCAQIRGSRAGVGIWGLHESEVRGWGVFWSVGLEGSENLVGRTGRSESSWARTRGLRLPSSWP